MKLRIQTLVFQQDGIPPHFSNVVRDSLNDKFSERWVGRYGLILIALTSSHRLFMWGLVKNIAYAENFWNINHLRERIEAAVGSIILDILQSVWTEIEFWLDICCVETEWTSRHASKNVLNCTT
jgi:hypothetical protein